MFQKSCIIWLGDDILSLRNIRDLLWHFDRVLMQFILFWSAKSLNIEVCSKEIAPRQFQAVLRFLKQNYILPVWGKSRHAYIHGAARFWWVRPMTSINTALNLKNKGDDFGERKCDFNTQKAAAERISSSLTQFMYVLILSLIMLFVNSIMSS